MKKTLKLLSMGFESSSTKTKEFTDFVRVFKSDFKKELKLIDATDIKFNKGHFYISGFFTVGKQIYYFSLSDVRGMEYVNNPTLMYRTAEHHKDWTGGSNRWVNIESGMFEGKNL